MGTPDLVRPCRLLPFPEGPLSEVEDMPPHESLIWGVDFVYLVSWLCSQSQKIAKEFRHLAS